MPRKKKASDLPPVRGASPPWSSSSSRSAASARKHPDGQRQVFWDHDMLKAGSGDAPTRSEPSTAASASLGISLDDARSISQMLDDSLQVTSGFSTAPDSVNTTPNSGWEVQSPVEIIKEVVQCVHERKPWRRKLDDSILEQKHNERQDRLDHGFHIILPDNRVRVMEDELSYRVKCSLLDTTPVEEEQTPAPRRADKSKGKNQRMRQNPWYKSPTRWYSLEEKLKAESTEDDSNDFPYANVILNVREKQKSEDQSSAQAQAVLTQFQKESLDMYKQFMKGQRLPHFLQ